jgi:hypothetical protein
MSSEANSHSELDGLGEVDVAIEFGGWSEMNSKMRLSQAPYRARKVRSLEQL